MKVKAALLHGAHQEWVVEEVDLGDPVDGEVQVRLAGSGMCHSDHHLRTGGEPNPFPVVGGHEGAGVVTKVGRGVKGLEEGDHVVTAFMPACGTCRTCASGYQNLCDEGAKLFGGGSIADGTHRVNYQGTGVLQMCLLGTFSPYITVNQASVVKIEKDIPLREAALLGCGVPTGWGSVTNAGGTKPGDTVVVIGVGGVGINAVQGAVAAGARFVVAVDPVEFKRTKALEFGATHAFASAEEALEPLRDVTWGQLANVTVITTGAITGDIIKAAMDLTAKLGTVVATSLGNYRLEDVSLNLYDLVCMQKRLQGALFGGRGPRDQIPLLANHYRSGSLRLNELITRTYKLEDINQGYSDMLDGINLRGLIEYTDADY
jgi:NDMA-dependent alcohol dehydrogenase